MGVCWGSVWLTDPSSRTCCTFSSISRNNGFTSPLPYFETIFVAGKEYEKFLYGKEVDFS